MLCVREKETDNKKKKNKKIYILPTTLLPTT